MPGNYSKLVTVITGQTITASERNNEFDNVINNMTPDGVDDASLTTAAMQATADPSGANAPTTLRGEIQRLRFQLLKLGAASGNWYDSLPFLAGVTPVAGAAAATDLNNRLAQIVGQIKSGLGLTNWYDAITAPVQSQNILINGGMEIWQRGSSFSNPVAGTYTADRWKIDKGASTTVPTMDVAQVTANREAGGGSVDLDMNISSVGSGATSCSIMQLVENYTDYGTKTVTCTARIKTSLSGVHIELYDGVSITASANHSGGGAWETITVTKTLSSSISSLRCYIGFGSQAPSGTGHIYVDQVMMVLGSQAITYVARPYATELLLCQRYFQVIGALQTADYIVTCQCLTTTVVIGAMRFPVPMRVSPTLTVNNPTHFSVSNASGGANACSGMSADTPSVAGFRILPTAGTANLVAGNATNLFTSNADASVYASAEL